MDSSTVTVAVASMDLGGEAGFAESGEGHGETARVGGGDEFLEMGGK